MSLPLRRSPSKSRATEFPRILRRDSINNQVAALFRGAFRDSNFRMPRAVRDSRALLLLRPPSLSLYRRSYYWCVLRNAVTPVASSIMAATPGEHRSIAPAAARLAISAGGIDDGPSSITWRIIKTGYNNHAVVVAFPRKHESHARARARKF